MSIKPKILQQEGYQIMGAAFEVYNEQGYGMAEEIYQESLEIEFGARSIPFQAMRLPRINGQRIRQDRV